MKRVVALLLALSMAIALCACSGSRRVKQVEALITSIGRVSADSKEAFEKAKQGFDELSDEEKASVENAAELEKAISDYLLILIKSKSVEQVQEKLKSAYTTGYYKGCELFDISYFYDISFDDDKRTYKGNVSGKARVAVPYITGTDKEYCYAISGSISHLEPTVSINQYEQEPSASIEGEISNYCRKKANSEMRDIVNKSSSLQAVKLYYLETTDADLKYDETTGRFACVVTAHYTMVIKEPEDKDWYFCYVGHMNNNEVIIDEAPAAPDNISNFWKEYWK